MLTIEIIVNKKLEKSSLSCFAGYFKVYLPINCILKPKEQQTVCLNFKIKTVKTIVSNLILSQIQLSGNIQLK